MTMQAHLPIDPILVVDDDPQLRQIIQWALEDEGYTVETVADGRAAVAWLADQRPGLVVLDWGLPLLSGDGVASAVRAAHGDAIPILLVTADGHSAEKAKRAGAAAYLNKPFTIDDLVGSVRHLLGPLEM